MTTAIATAAALAVVPFTFTFNFKSVGDDAKFGKFLEDYDASVVDSIRSQFEQVENRAKEKVWKRKSVTAQLEMPAAFANLPARAQSVLQQFIADFVRSAYIDNFAEVGQHDWDYIEQELASTGSRGVKLDVDPEVLKAAAASFGQYITAAKKSQKVGELLASLLLKKCTVMAFKRYVGEASDTAFDRVEGMLTAWAEWVAANDAENADDFAGVYELATRAIARNRKSEVVDVLAVLG